jgi:hypothetical protein
MVMYRKSRPEPTLLGGYVALRVRAEHLELYGSYSSNRVAIPLPSGLYRVESYFLSDSDEVATVYIRRIPSNKEKKYVRQGSTT